MEFSSRLDQNTVNHRRMFLERYMEQLCVTPATAASAELRLFLDYELPDGNKEAATPTTLAPQRVP